MKRVMRGLKDYDKELDFMVSVIGNHWIVLRSSFIISLTFQKLTLTAMQC